MTRQARPPHDRRAGPSTSLRAGPRIPEVPAPAVVDIWLQPGASRQRIVGMRGDAVKVAVAAPPEKGAANRALEKLLAEEFGVAPGAVTVIAGAASRRKRVRLQGVAPERVREWMARWKT